jgi:subtilisin family serine protease
VSPQYLEELAKIDRVRHIEEYVAPKLFNNVAVGILNADTLHSIGLEGANQVIAVCDTGFDKGSTTDVHPAFTDRVLKLYAMGRTLANDPDGHGTHVAGSVLGDGTSATMGGVIRGTAPKAKLVLQSVLDRRGGLGGLPFDLNDLFKVPYNNDGARVHTNSWGAAVSGKYDQSSEQVDEFVWNHRDCVICFAAGNEGTDKDGNGVIDAGSIGSPGSAKNCITVGATENNRSDQSKPYSVIGYASEPLASDGWSDDPEGMVAFSSRGPTRNQRIKPDVVAPGTAILSTLSRDAIIDDFFGKSLDPLYAFLAGTSMATPLVAGCAAVVREYFQTKHSHQPSAALVKAMLINGAKNISGQYVPSESGRIPNFAEGFGRVDLAATVAETIIFQDERTELDTGEEETTIVNVSSPNSLLKVTLVWTDPPGEALQNDLDLIVRTAAGRERHGNMRGTSTKFDRVNNVEQVIWSNIPVGDVAIFVRAHRTIAPQSYALVAQLL